MVNNKDKIVKKITDLTEQKSKIEQELLSLKKQCTEVLQNEYKQYIGKYYKQFIEDKNSDYENDLKTVYYKILDFDDDEDDGTQFWVLVVEDHMENNIDIPLSYIYKTSINLLGYKKFFLKKLTPISEEEFNKALDNVINTIKNNLI